MTASESVLFQNACAQLPFEARVPEPNSQATSASSTNIKQVDFRYPGTRHKLFIRYFETQNYDNSFLPIPFPCVESICAFKMHRSSDTLSFPQRTWCSNLRIPTALSVPKLETSTTSTLTGTRTIHLKFQMNLLGTIHIKFQMALFQHC